MTQQRMRLFRWTRDMLHEGYRAGDKKVMPEAEADKQVAAGNGEICPSVFDPPQHAGEASSSSPRPRRHYPTRKA